MENVSPARPIRVPMPPLMLQKAQSSCKPVLHKYAMQLGKITDDTVKFEDWAFPLEQVLDPPSKDPSRMEGLLVCPDLATTGPHQGC